MTAEAATTRRAIMAGRGDHVSVFGSKRSAKFNWPAPSKPPHMYNFPLRITATARLRRSSIDGNRLQFSILGSKHSTVLRLSAPSKPPHTYKQPPIVATAG